MFLQLETLKLLRNKLRVKVVKRATTIFNLQYDKLSENVARITWPYRTCAVRSLTSSYAKALVLVHPLWGPFSKTYVFGARKRRLRVDGRLKRGKKLSFQKYPHMRGRGLNYIEENLLFSLTGFSTGEKRRLNWRRTFHEPNLIHWIKYMKSSASQPFFSPCPRGILFGWN